MTLAVGIFVHVLRIDGWNLKDLQDILCFAPSQLVASFTLLTNENTLNVVFCKSDIPFSPFSHEQVTQSCVQMKQIKLYVEKTMFTNDMKLSDKTSIPYSPQSVHKNAYSCICIYI